MPDNLTVTPEEPRRQPSAILQPRNGWQTVDLRELWRFRDLLSLLALRDIKVRYKQTALGAAWAIIVPVAQMVVFTVFFGNLLGAGDKAREVAGQYVAYPIFLFSAQLPWNLFASTINTSAASLVQEANLLRKIYFPRLIVPLASAGAPLVDFAVAFLVLIALMIWFGQALTWGLLLLPLLVLSTLIAAMGAGLLLASLAVSYRDFRAVVPFLVQIWFFVTPVIISVDFVPEKWRWAMLLNPMAGPIEGFRAAVLGTPIDFVAWGVSTGVGLVLLVAGVAYFSRVERCFADVV